MILTLKHLAPVVCLASALAGAVLHAQTVTITPTGYIAVGPGGTQQYKAVVTGDTGVSNAVTWYAGSKVGGNATVGTISTTVTCPR